MEQFLSGKIAVVTGGTRGIGFAIASALARAGASVTICGREDADAQAAAQRIEKDSGVSVSGQAADVSQWAEVEKLFASVRQNSHGKLNILINNAGVGVFKPVAELTPEEWHRVLDLNLTGVFYCCRAALPLLKAAGDGYVFNISSLAGKNAFAGGAAYNASKFGLNGFTEAMMLDHRHDNIRVTSIMPGSVDTDFGSVPEQSRKSGQWKIQSEDIAEVILSLLRIPARTLVSRVEMRPSKPPR